MQCDRLISLVKNWYLKVQEETMAPARMVAFMEKHISQCEVCLADPDVKQEADKIREIVLPPSKIPKPKVVRVPKDADDDEEEYDDEDETSEDEDEDEDSESNDEDEDDEDYDPDIIDDDEI
jgi:hypothetical protein